MIVIGLIHGIIPGIISLFVLFRILPLALEADRPHRRRRACPAASSSGPKPATIACPVRIAYPYASARYA